MTAHTDIKSPMLAAALDYAARGWHVFPAPPGEKKSHLKGANANGARWGATTDPTLIVSYWDQFPRANVGIAAGPSSGFFVVECDTPAGHDVDGIGNMAALIEQHGPLPDTIEALSPSGSWHIFFRWPEGEEIINGAGEVAPGIDVRGEGGMVIGVPSVKPGRPQPYRWKNPPGLFELGECPEWLLALCRKKKLSEQARANGPKIDTGGHGWADAALRGEIAAVLSSPAGSRNAQLNTSAFNLGQIIAGGALDEASVRSRLCGAAIAAGLDEAEIGPTIDSGLKAGMQNPRGPKERQDFGAAKDSGEDDHIPPGNNAPDEIDLSHDALALELGRLSWDRNAKFVAAWGRWLFWDGTRWTRDETLDHMTRCRAYLRKRAEELQVWAARKADTLDDKDAQRIKTWAEDQAKALRNKITVAAVEAMAQSNPGSVARAQEFDTDLLKLGTPGGTVDLKTGILHPAQRGDMITKLVAVTPAPQGAVPALWLRFLGEVFNGDQEIITFMQRAAGYALTGLTTEHKLLFLHGTGRNGKSTFLDTLQWLVGDYARRAAAQTFLYSQTQQHPTDIAGLQGARLVVGSELPKGKTWDEAVIKDLTGGDRMTARFMRGDFFDFDPQLTLMIAGNNMPSFRGVDEAIRARVVLVPFTVTIPAEKRDKSLPEKLKAEGPAILRWAIEGALMWQAKGLCVPASIAAASQEYFDDEDTLGQFLADETEPAASGYFVSASDLHQRFAQWCQAQGLQDWTQRTLVKELKTRGFQEMRRTSGRGFQGLRLR